MQRAHTRNEFIIQKSYSSVQITDTNHPDVCGSLKPQATNLPQSLTGDRTATVYSCIHTTVAGCSFH